MTRLGDWWATEQITQAAQVITRDKLNELEDADLAELHTAIMKIRHKIVTVQRHRRHRAEDRP